MEQASPEAALREFLTEQFGAVRRRSWGLDAYYRGNRLFAILDEGDLVGKWPVTRRERLRATIPGVRPFMSDMDAADASWLRVPLGALPDLGAAIELALESSAYVETAEGAPRGLSRQTR